MNQNKDLCGKTNSIRTTCDGAVEGGGVRAKGCCRCVRGGIFVYHRFAWNEANVFSLNLSPSIFVCLFRVSFSDSTLPLSMRRLALFVAVCSKSQYFIYFVEKKELPDCRSAVQFYVPIFPVPSISIYAYSCSMLVGVR